MPNRMYLKVVRVLIEKLSHFRSVYLSMLFLCAQNEVEVVWESDDECYDSWKIENVSQMFYFYLVLFYSQDFICLIKNLEKSFVPRFH